MALLLGKKEDPCFRQIPVEEIRPNPAQPRRRFDEEGVRSLAASIGRYGVLQPLTVRRTEAGYQLIAGERRLRASREAGLRTVPCVILSREGEDSAVLAVIENLQRQDLDLFEEAAAFASLMARFGLTQEEVAARLSVSQSCVANKLRLLKLEDDVREGILAHHLTERHARALLRLPPGDARRRALAAVSSRGMNVAKTEAYVDKLLRAEGAKPPAARRGGIRDFRLLSNSMDRAVALARRAGVSLEKELRETETEWIYVVHVAKNRAGQQSGTAELAKQ